MAALYLAQQTKLFFPRLDAPLIGHLCASQRTNSRLTLEQVIIVYVTRLLQQFIDNM